MKQTRMTLLALCCVMAVLACGWAGENERAGLLGSWAAQSLEKDGKNVPASEFKTLRLTFKEDKLIVRGNFGDDAVDECMYQIDAKKSPRQLEFTPSKEKMPILGIYEIKGDELKICLRTRKGPRPEEFATKADSGLILVVFKKTK